MRISDWSSDVCSSDLSAANHLPGVTRKLSLPEMIGQAAEPLPDFDDPAFGALFDRFADRRVVLLGEARDRKSGVEGKRVSVRVDLGGRRIIKKKLKQMSMREGR